MFHPQDTICAQATAVGSGGIAILRMSGPDAKRIAAKVFQTNRPSRRWKPRYMYLGKLMDGDTLLDQALGVYFAAPASYTGEDVFEFHCHGGAVVAELVMELLLKQGARPAEPGEFTKRAFLNGKMDISAAEAVADQISALSAQGAKQAARQMQGELARRIEGMQTTLTDILAEMEAGIEYPEEDLELAIAGDALPPLGVLAAEMSALQGSFKQGKLLREGIRVALAGRPNVGKSSLLNAIFGEDRAIVSDIPGTTRDVISEHYLLHSLPVLFLDTAGVRETGDVVEQIGVARSHQAMESAACVVLVLDSSEPLQPEDFQVYDYARKLGVPLLVALNKTDLAGRLTAADVMEQLFRQPEAAMEMERAAEISELLTDAAKRMNICHNKTEETSGLLNVSASLSHLCHNKIFEISAKNRDGVDALLEEIYTRAVGDAGLQEGVMLTNSRHAFSLQQALGALEDGIAALEAGIDLDCASIDLHDAWRYLGEITGRTLDEQIINRIFEKFCLGK